MVNRGTSPIRKRLQVLCWSITGYTGQRQTKKKACEIPWNFAALRGCAPSPLPTALEALSSLREIGRAHRPTHGWCRGRALSAHETRQSTRDKSTQVTTFISQHGRQLCAGHTQRWRAGGGERHTRPSPEPRSLRPELTGRSLSHLRTTNPHVTTKSMVFRPFDLPSQPILGGNLSS